jgi:ABC-type lipoprotein export system ATPase subunit
MVATTQAHVRIANVSKKYGDHGVEALRGINLDIAKGRFIALMGPSGCGKSTLLNCIAGIDKPTSGAILIDGADVTKLSDEQLTLLRREKIGFVFQFFNLLSTLTARENIELPLDLAGRLSRGEIRSRVDALLGELGLLPRADSYPAQLSGGEMQRVAVMRAIVHGPQIILADEPTGNLDTVNGEQILALLKRLCSERGETILMATHSEEAAGYADSIIRMKDGQIVEAS